eukprot:308825-Pyramimonas_sp.AAC.1
MREEVQGLLQLAAAACGVDAGQMGSRSLRIGGATASYRACRDLEAVKRFGRWPADAFHGYLLEDHRRQAPFARGMAEGHAGTGRPRR